MRGRLCGSVALIDGLGALFLITILYIGTGAIGSEIQRAKAEAIPIVELEDLRGVIHDAITIMNITSQPLDTDAFEIGALRFAAWLPNNVTYQSFFLSDDVGVRVFYITEKD